MIKAVLLDERDKFRKLNQIRLLGPLLRKGILTSEGAEWKWQRQAAAPVFRRDELPSLVPGLLRAAEGVGARLPAAPAGPRAPPRGRHDPPGLPRGPARRPPPG